MVSDWRKLCLADISKDVSYGYTESAVQDVIGPHFLRITDIQNGMVNWSTVPFCPIDEDLKHKYLLERGDIVVARTGNSTGENYIFTGDKETVYASYLIRFKINVELADPFYVWYSMRSPQWWSFVESSKTGSAQAGANAKVLGLYNISLPPINTQKAIAHILGTLDDKIELNRKMNETLESMAQALFKSWFVDFDPVIDNALAAGNEIPEALQERAAARQALGDKRKPLPEEIQKLFPSSFEFSDELGWIPEGWEETPIKEIGQVICGKTPSTKKSEYYGEDIPFITIPDMHNTVIATNTVKKLSKEGADSQSNKYLPPGSICVSCIATPGLVVLTSEDSQTNQQINSIIPFETGVELFLYEALSILGDTVRSSGSGGSVFSNLSKGRFENLTVTLPPVTTQVAFSKLLKATFSKMHNTETESYILSRLRDTLLPKLLSGELRIPDADKLIEEAV